MYYTAHTALHTCFEWIYAPAAAILLATFTMKVLLNVFPSGYVSRVMVTKLGGLPRDLYPVVSSRTAVRWGWWDTPMTFTTLGWLEEGCMSGWVYECMVFEGVVYECMVYEGMGV
jgi:hypothetical protein